MSVFLIEYRRLNWRFFFATMYLSIFIGREIVFMKLLEDRIRRDGKIRSGGVLKVDSF